VREISKLISFPLQEQQLEQLYLPEQVQELVLVQELASS
jgi:hypothetical protein